MSVITYIWAFFWFCHYPHEITQEQDIEEAPKTNFEKNMEEYKKTIPIVKYPSMIEPINDIEIPKKQRIWSISEKLEFDEKASIAINAMMEWYQRQRRRKISKWIIKDVEPRENFSPMNWVSFDVERRIRLEREEDIWKSFLKNLDYIYDKFLSSNTKTKNDATTI